MKYCTHCGAPEQPGARFCPTCGRRYDDGSAPFSWKNALNWRLFEAFIERCVRRLDFVSDVAERWVRKAHDAIVSENYAAPSFILWNLLALLFASVPCGLIGTAYSIRVLQLKQNNDDSPVAASKYAKLWFALAVVWLFVVRCPVFFRTHFVL